MAIDNYRARGEKYSDGAKFMDLFLIQDPAGVDPGGGYNKDLMKYYKNSIPVRDISDFVYRVNLEFMQRRLPIRNMIIGSHGGGWPNNKGGGGFFRIGKTFIEDDDTVANIAAINVLRSLAGYFVEDAHLFLVACKTGYAQPLMQKVSAALGGVKVHGYTELITTASYGPFGATLDD